MKVLHNLKDPVFEDQYAESFFYILAYFYNEIIILEFYPDFNRFIGIKHLKSEDGSAINIQQLKDSNLLTNINYRKKLFVIPSENFTLVPDEFYEESEITNIYNLNFKKNIGNKIEARHIEDMGFNIIYSNSKDLIKIGEDLKTTHIINTSHSLIQGIKHSVFTENKKYFHIDFEPESIKLVLFLNGSLQFYNSFKISSKEDALYHILNVSKQLGVNPNEDTYFLSGLIEKNSTTEEFLKKYIRYTEYVIKSNHFSYSTVFDKVELHHYFTSLFSVLCV